MNRYQAGFLLRVLRLQSALALALMCWISGTAAAQQTKTSEQSLETPPRITLSLTTATGAPDLLSLALTGTLSKYVAAEVGGAALLPGAFVRAGMRIPLPFAPAGRAQDLLLLAGYRTVIIPLPDNAGGTYYGPTFTAGIRRWDLLGSGLVWQLSGGPWWPMHSMLVDDLTGERRREWADRVGEVRLSFGWRL
jgi:hypothetical protein